jgi:uncharacterized protein (TIGR03546 family)
MVHGARYVQSGVVHKVAKTEQSAMLVFLVKQIMSVRAAIVGRNEPAQLAWGVAFGVLLGIVPHGNLLAVMLLLLLLSLRVNHGIATVAAVGTTLLATRLDPYSHQLGRLVLMHQDFSRHLANAWQLPFVPWTDINNTVVLGSFLIGLAALLPIFLLTYPVFHWFAPKGTPIDGTNSSAAVALDVPNAVTDVRGTIARTRPAENDARPVVSVPLNNASPSLEPSAIDAAMSGLGTKSETKTVVEPHLIETRIDVIRVGKRKPTSADAEVEAKDVSEQDEPMSEALNYLLRQLRDTRQRRAA